MFGSKNYLSRKRRETISRWLQSASPTMRQKKKSKADEHRSRSRGRRNERTRDRETSRNRNLHKDPRGTERPRGSRERRVYERLNARKGGEREYWEFHNVTLTRVAGYGFGIAVSGGRDNPHFANGDPSIAISDVLKAGPAEGKLRINDRVISANGVSLENVDYATAVQVLRECGATAILVIKRRVVLPPNINEPQTLKVTVTKSKKKDDFGIVLGCWIYVKEITNRSLLDKEGSVHEGDIITKINNNNTESLTLKEAKKLIDNSKDKLHLVVRREPHRSVEPQQTWTMRNPMEPSVIHNKDMPSTTPPNFIDTTTTRTHWSNQNVYVQSPTRGDYRPSSERVDSKNNLTRPQGNWNHLISDVQMNHFENLNHLHMNSHSSGGIEDLAPPPRPPLPHLDEADVRRDLYPDHSFRRPTSPPDPRFISFQKDGSLGIRLAGGNEVGIFVTGVQPGSAAFLQGLQPGDKILKVNDIEMRGFTKEEAVTFLHGIQDQVNLIVQHRKEEYEDVMASQKGDSFYIRTHFSHESTGKGELSFRKGEVFHVVDTLYNGNSGSWLVFRLGRNGQEIQRGIIPNGNRARELALEHQNASKKDQETESRGSFFRRRARRSKSLCKDHWEDVVLADSVSRFPAYERVVLKQPGFIRPVVLFGPLTDVVKDRLLKDYPGCYASPQSDSQAEDEQSNLKSPGIIRLSAIRDVIDKGKHAILDITPSAVDRLNYAQFYPIVIFMHAENKHVIKELRAKWAKSSYKSSRKLFEHAVKLEKLWSHIFTATINLTTGDSWYKKLQETIDRQQKQPLWVSEAKPDEAITDDFLFPMTSRLSYASSPESDLDLSIDTRSTVLKECQAPDDRRLVKSSSDPSIAALDEFSDARNRAQYPSYSLGRNGQLHPYYIFHRETSVPVQALMEQANDMLPVQAKVVTTDDPAYAKHFSNFNDINFSPSARSRIDPYATLTSSERIANQINGQLSDSYHTKERFTNSQSPPMVDRANKPAKNYGQGRQNICDLNLFQDHNYINTAEVSKNSDQGQQEQVPSSHGGDSYPVPPRVASPHTLSAASTSQGFVGTLPASAFSSTFSSSTLPYQSMTLDRAKLSHMSSKTRHDVRPPPPPPPVKPAGFKPRLVDGRPVPPPKPTQYHGKQWQNLDGNPDAAGRNLVSETSIRTDSSSVKQSNTTGQIVPHYQSRSYPTSPSKPPPPPKRKDLSFYKQANKQQSQENAGDSGHGDSPERPVMGHSFSQGSIVCSSSSDRAYSNVRFGESVLPQQPLPSSSPPLPPPPTGLDLATREDRGSAFELYKKSDSQIVTNNHQGYNSQKRYTLESPNATHSVVATAQGVFGSSGGVLSSKETGVTVIIPPGAISEGLEQEIYFKVCQDANMLPALDKEKGETLLSPLVMCGPDGLKFNVPIELRLPHCASISPDSWSFALNSSDTPSGDPTKWRNISLDNTDGVTSSRVEADYVSVLVDHF